MLQKNVIKNSWSCFCHFIQENMFLSHLFPGQRLSPLWDKKKPTSPFYKLSLHHGPLLHGTCHRCDFTESWALPCDFTNATFPSRLHAEPGQGARLSLVHHFIPIPQPGAHRTGTPSICWKDGVSTKALNTLGSIPEFPVSMQWYHIVLFVCSVE